jgi:hypothetical protein
LLEVSMLLEGSQSLLVLGDVADLLEILLLLGVLLLEKLLFQ